MALFFYSLAQDEVGLENIMQLPAYRCSLPHFASEWKKKQLYILLCVFKKGGQNYFWRGFLHQSGFQGDNGPMGFKEIFQNPKIHIPISDLCCLKTHTWVNYSLATKSFQFRHRCCCV